jgi:hypothetical protein
MLPSQGILASRNTGPGGVQGASGAHPSPTAGGVVLQPGPRALGKRGGPAVAMRKSYGASAPPAPADARRAEAAAVAAEEEEEEEEEEAVEALAAWALLLPRRPAATIQNWDQPGAERTWSGGCVG